MAERPFSGYFGFAFDDYLGYAHAWTLVESNRDEKFDGLGFFDYRGYFERTKASSDPSALADGHSSSVADPER